MKAVVMEGPRKSKVMDVEIPKINDNQLLVKVKYTGMCHSDWYPWATAAKGMRLGHEPVGVVADMGKNVRGFSIGDRVTGLGGGHSEYTVMEQQYAIKIPDNVADEDAVAEPLSCQVSAVSKVPVAIPGDPVVVVGAGYMGLGAISLFRVKGAGHIIAVDPREEAREHAKQWGADEVYAPDEVPKDYLLNWDNWGHCDMFHTGFGSVMEFSGTESGLNLAGQFVRAHGTMGIGGYHNDGLRTVDYKLWNVKAITTINCHERRCDFQTECGRNALDMLSTGVWKYKGVATHIYSMEEFDKGNEEMDSKPKGYIKALVRCSD